MLALRRSFGPEFFLSARLFAKSRSSRLRLLQLLLVLALERELEFLDAHSQVVEVDLRLISTKFNYSIPPSSRLRATPHYLP